MCWWPVTKRLRARQARDIRRRFMAGRDMHLLYREFGRHVVERAIRMGL